jgi:phage shock protein A
LPLTGKGELMSHSAYPPEPRSDDTAAAASTPVGDYDEAGVPTFEHVRDKIEGRYATALGGTELAEESEAGRSIAQQQADREAAARERLEQIRRSVQDDK